jgi:hypothetical protein
MKKYDDLWKNINNLLSHLRSSKVREMVDIYYLDGYGNDAPGKLLQMEIDRLQEKLDNAEEN